MSNISKEYQIYSHGSSRTISNTIIVLTIDFSVWLQKKNTRLFLKNFSNYIFSLAAGKNFSLERGKKFNLAVFKEWCAAASTADLLWAPECWKPTY